MKMLWWNFQNYQINQKKFIENILLLIIFVVKYIVNLYNGKKPLNNLELVHGKDA